MTSTPSRNGIKCSLLKKNVCCQCHTGHFSVFFYYYNIIATQKACFTEAKGKTCVLHQLNGSVNHTEPWSASIENLLKLLDVCFEIASQTLVVVQLFVSKEYYRYFYSSAITMYLHNYYIIHYMSI